MRIKSYLGTARRSIYNARDGVLYRKWIKENERAEEYDAFKWHPLLSIVVPVYNPDPVFFKAMVESVVAQSYGNWELILVDDKSPQSYAREAIKKYARSDSRIKYVFLEKNHHIARATNAGIKIAKGDYIGLLDHDDVLHRDALSEVVLSLNKNSRLEFIYTDEDRIIGSRRLQPMFKPGLNVDMLHSVNYITHFSVIRKTTLETVGYERHEYNGAQDWELFLRVIRNISPENIHHIPKILYSWRVHELSTSKDMAVKPYVLAAQEKAITDDLQARGMYTNLSLRLDEKYSGQWKSACNIPKKSRILYTCENSIERDQLNGYQFVAFIKGSISSEKRRIAQYLSIEAARSDINFVLTGKSHVMINNLVGLIGESKARLIRQFTHISVAKHLYTTVRYNLSSVRDYDIAVIEVSKLKHAPIVDPKVTSNNLPNLYIPYRDLL